MTTELNNKSEAVSCVTNAITWLQTSTPTKVETRGKSKVTAHEPASGELAAVIAELQAVKTRLERL